MTIELFHPFYAGIILCAMLAATFSTIDSQILVLSSMMSEDIYKKIVNTKASDKQIIAISRISIIIISLISLSITFITKKSIFILVTYCWSGLGCALGPTIIMCLYFKKINKYGVIFGIIVGGIIGIIWIYFNLQIYSIIPGFLSGLITIYSISKLFEKYRVN